MLGAKILGWNRTSRRESIWKIMSPRKARFIRGRPLAYMIYKHFRVTGTNEFILEFFDLMKVILREVDVQGFDIKWNEVLSSVRETPKHNTLKGMYGQTFMESEQLKTTNALFNQNTVQKNEPTNCTLLKNMSKGTSIRWRRIEIPMPETTGQRVELPSQGKHMTEAKEKTGKQEVVDNDWRKERAPKESHAMSNMTWARKAKAKRNVIDQVLRHWNTGHKANTKNIERCSKRESPGRHHPVW